MKLLLDTHIWVWSALDRERLTARLTATLENPRNELWLSPISLWEVLVGGPDPLPEKQADIASESAVVDRKCAGMWFPCPPITYQVAQETARVQLPHRDPADRFLVATARVFGLTLVTADEQLLKARQSPVLANR
jgi:PIN domain nuclease of toxin-antitoxin system